MQLYVPAGASACSTAAGKLNAYLAASPCSKGQYFDTSFNCQACPPFTFQPSDSHYDTECATADVSTCSDAGNFDFTTGTCTCNDAFAGPACEYSNAVTCNDAGVAQPDGSCACNTNDPSVGGIGPACAHTNAETCNDAGVAQPDGSCVCNTNDPSVGGIGPACAHTNAETCNDAGVAQADGSCVCNTNDPSAGGIGPACAHTNAETCNDAGVAKPDGSCVCNTNDPSAGGIGPACAHTNALNCNNVGTAQADGSCVCDGPVTGLGKTCSEISNALNCNNVGTAQADGSCVCDSPVTGLGKTCSEISNALNCNGQATVKPDGTCAPPCSTNGYKGDRCDECFTDTHDLIENGTVSRIAFCADPTDPATCDSPGTTPIVQCVPKGDTAICDLGERAVDGECVLCDAGTYADGTRADGSNDGGIRVQCKACPPNTITQQLGASSLNDCVASCEPGEYSLDSVCTPCGNSKFADGTTAPADGAASAPDDGRRTTCKACPPGSAHQLSTSATINDCICANDDETNAYFYVSEEQQSCVKCPNNERSVEGATNVADCFAAFQSVEGQRFCYGKGSDSRASQADANVADEFVFAFSRVGADDDDEAAALLCQEAAQGIPNATFIPLDQLACKSSSADGDACAAAYDIAVRTSSNFCHPLFETRIGDTFGYPQLMCREYECKQGGQGSCWPPDERAGRPDPLGCVRNIIDNTVMYYSAEGAALYYSGFDYEAVCERYICPTNPENVFEKPVPLTEKDFEAATSDTSKVPECRLSARGVNKEIEEASDLNNKTFIPIAISISVFCMLVAAYITREELQLMWITFGVGLRTFDMQTDWGFFAISLKDLGFRARALYGDETADGYNYDQLLADGDVMTEPQLNRMVNTCLAFCILGTLMTPFDILGNLKRTEGQHGFAMLISILILAFEDVPQLYLNIKYTTIMGAGDPISILSLIASILNILYNVGLLLSEFCQGKSPLDSFA